MSPHKVLIQLVTQYGHGLSQDPRRLKALLHDYLPQHRREARVLLSVVEERLAEELLRNKSDGTPWSILRPRLVVRLHNATGIDVRLAQWALDVWGIVLGVLGEKESIATPHTQSAPLHVATKAHPDKAPLSASTEAVKYLDKGRRYWGLGDGTVLDTTTGLRWMRCYFGQTWSGNSCTGEARRMAWCDAMEIKLAFAGKKDWRLPTIDELHSIVCCPQGRRPIVLDAKGRTVKVNGVLQDGRCLGVASGSPTIDLNVFPNAVDDRVWSGSPYAASSGSAWAVNFSEGKGDWYAKYAKYLTFSVRLVRNQ
ncbi:MAG: DUF1566 domain-containing protein [Halothiobacillaceae bacterium]